LNSGATVDDDTQTGAIIMMFSALAYIIGQGVALAYLSDPSGVSAKKVERWFALCGLIVCILLLITYCVYQVVNPKLQKKKIEAAKEKLRLQLAIAAFSEKLEMIRGRASGAGTARSPLLPDDESDDSEDAGAAEEAMKPEMVRTFGLKWKSKAETAKQEQAKKTGVIQADEMSDTDDEENPEEEEKGGDPKKIVLEAAFWLILGTAIVAFFSDPMVDVITDFGVKINVSAFFVSFIITPFCSNASELISSLIFASKMKRKNSSLTYSAIYGAATMNNTLVLGIFYGLIFFRKLAWTFSAEVFAILFVTYVQGLTALSFKTMRLALIFSGLGLYPAAIFLVWILKFAAHWK